MSDEKNPVEELLDVVLYAPIGFVFSARELLPGLVQKGRAQLGMAKMVGQFAAKEGEKRAGKLFESAMSTVEHLAGGGRANGTSNSATPEPAPAPVIDVVASDAPAPSTSGPEAATLAIPDYDSLSASQVLPRLNGLTSDELEAVRAYEAAHRGRKTILNRAAQLQQAS